MIAGGPFGMLECGFLLIGQVVAALLSVQQHLSNSGKVNKSLFISHVNSSLEWSQMLRSSNHSLWHVSVLDRNNPRNTLALLNESSAALEPAVGHTHLLSSIENDGNAVAFLIIMHDSADVHSAAFVLAAS
jgi:hypothetical protein